jgi:hypothetical protein
VKKSETIQLLTMAASVDASISPGYEPAVNLWYMTLAEIPYQLAEQALVARFRESTYPLKPADIVAGVAAIRKARRANVATPEPPRDLPAGSYPKWLQAFWAGVDAGQEPGWATLAADVALGQPANRAAIEATPSPNLPGLAAARAVIAAGAGPFSTEAHPTDT